MVQMTPESTPPPHFEPRPDDIRTGDATPPPPSRATPPARRFGGSRLAWTIAIAADFIQWVALPLFAGGFVSPWNNALDIAVAVMMIRLLGWHWSFLPTFLVELFPVFDLVPTWTLAVFLATRKQRALPPGGR
jgi:hypothetical protein